jgi:hypothetical protein
MMFPFTPEKVAKLTKSQIGVVRPNYPLLIDAAKHFKMVDIPQTVGLLATVAVECHFAPVVEEGDDDYFRQYEGSKVLGNKRTGDGIRFRGRGFILTFPPFNGQ